MKQVILNFKTGDLQVADVPPPALRPEGVLVRNGFSLISIGTERSKVQSARSNLLEKARRRPDQVEQAMQNLRQEGVLPTMRKVLTRLDTPVTLGYASAGTVVAVGASVNDLQIGDRVAVAGEGYGCHAEVIYVPRHMATLVPEGVGLDQAAFAAVGAIAVQSLRVASVSLGDRVVVIGLGLIGLLTVQLLKAAGCQVIGVDVDGARVELASHLGADRAFRRDRFEIEQVIAQDGHGYGFDAVIIAASTPSTEPIETAGRLCREKGAVVVVGAVPVDVPRKEYFEKELRLTISRGLGPGPYYAPIPERGMAYPYGYVRWTAQLNMEAFLNLVAEGRITLDPVITHCFPIDEAPKAYDLLLSPQGEVLGILFEYDTSADGSTGLTTGRRPSTGVVWLTDNAQRATCEGVTVGFIGAGNFAKAYLLPNFRRLDDVVLRGVATATSVSAANVARKFGFAYGTCDYHEILNDPKINCVVIATRHNLHASLAAEALRRGKGVFVEKPLALNLGQLREVIEAYQENERGKLEDERCEGENGNVPLSNFHSRPSPILMVGFNRRFSPFIQELKKFLAHRTGPIVMTYRVNAGYVPPDHWVHDPVEGGGRILGEVCHFVDLLQHLAGARPCRLFAQTTHTHSGHIPDEDNVQVTISFTDGSIGIITYSAAGDPSFPRERLEVFADGSVAVIDNFREAVFTRRGRGKRMRRWSQDMGHRHEVAALVEAIQQGGPAPIPFEEIVLTTLTTLQIKESLRLGEPVEIDLSQVLLGQESIDKADVSFSAQEESTENLDA